MYRKLPGTVRWDPSGQRISKQRGSPAVAVIAAHHSILPAKHLRKSSLVDNRLGFFCSRSRLPEQHHQLPYCGSMPSRCVVTNFLLPRRSQIATSLQGRGAFTTGNQQWILMPGCVSLLVTDASACLKLSFWAHILQVNLGRRFLRGMTLLENAGNTR